MSKSVSSCQADPRRLQASATSGFSEMSLSLQGRGMVQIRIQTLALHRLLSLHDQLCVFVLITSPR